MKQNLRLAAIPAEQRNKNDLQTLAYEDVKHLNVAGGNKPTLGFKFGN
jgi:hypothetical protein